MLNSHMLKLVTTSVSGDAEDWDVQLSSEELDSLEIVVDDRDEQEAYNEEGCLEMHRATTAFSSLPGETNKVYLGWEYEVLLDYDDCYYSDSHLSCLRETLSDSGLNKYINCYPDSGDAEMVSVPATLAFHRQHIVSPLFRDSAFTSNLREPKGAWVGQHVHVDYRSFNPRSLKNFIAFMHDKYNNNFIRFIAQRELLDETCENIGSKLDEVEIHLDKDRYNNRCFISIPDNPEVTLRKFTRTYHHHSGRTLEVRIFESPTCEAQHLKNLEFVDALVRYSRKKNFCYKYNKGFKAFVNKNKEKYPNLYDYLANNNLGIKALADKSYAGKM